MNWPGYLRCLDWVSWVTLSCQLANIRSYLFPSMLRSYNQKTKPLPLSFKAFPILIRFGISMFFHGKTRISQFFTVDKIDIWTISLIFKFISLLFNILDEIIIKISRATNLEFLDFGSKKLSNLILNFPHIFQSSSFKYNSLLTNKEINIMRILINII